MAAEEPLGALWDFLRAQGVTFAEETGVIAISGHEFAVEIPSDLVSDSAG